MNASRFSQLRNLDVRRGELSKYISQNNEMVIDKCGVEIFKNYIIHFLEKYKVSQKDLINYSEFITFTSGKPLDTGTPIVTELYNFLIKNILLPNYTHDQDGDFKEIDAILDRAIHRVERLMKQSDENGFFSIRFHNLDHIKASIALCNDFEPQIIKIGGIFEDMIIENDSETDDFSVIIPVRLAKKIKVSQETSDIRPGIAEKDLNAILKTILENNWKRGRKYKKSNKLDVRVEEEKIAGNQLYWHLSKDEEYKVYRVFVSQMSLDSYINKDSIVELLSEVFWAVEDIVNTIAKKSNHEYQKKIYNFDTGTILFNNEQKQTSKSDLSPEDSQKFEWLKVSLKEKVWLCDIGGQPNAKAEVEKIILSLKNEEIMKSWGARPTSWIVFEWPAGTGKTLLAKALASEIDADVYNVKLTDIASSAYINEWANNVKNLFAFIREKSRNGKKIVVILDELDALFVKRESDKNSWEDTKIVNTFLSEMSGLETTENVIFIGTTNRIDDIDPAAIRSGRLTTSVKVDKPDLEWLTQILDLHLKKIAKKSRKFANAIKDIDVTKVASHASGLSGADIEEVIRIVAEEKWLEEIRNQWENIEMIIHEANVLEAIKKVKTSKIAKWNSIGFLSK